MPNRPYQDAPPEKLIADLDLVAAEIRRFAGEEAYAPPTVIHFAMTRHSAFKPLYEPRRPRADAATSGTPAANGTSTTTGTPWSPHICARHNAWKDFESGIVFSRASITCNLVPVDRIAATLEPLAKDPNRPKSWTCSPTNSISGRST